MDIDLNTHITKYSPQLKYLILLEVEMLFLMLLFARPNCSEMICFNNVIFLFFNYYMFRNYNMKPLVRHQDYLKFI